MPKRVEQNLLEECLKLRNGSRIPVSTYYWSEAKTSLWRAAKVKAGQEGNKFNQAYLKEIGRDLLIIDLNEEYSHQLPKSVKTINHSFRFMTNHGLNNLFQKIVVTYSKDEDILRVVERWNEDILNILKSGYLAVEEMKVLQALSSEAGRSSSRKTTISTGPGRCPPSSN